MLLIAQCHVVPLMWMAGIYARRLRVHSAGPHAHIYAIALG